MLIEAAVFTERGYGTDRRQLTQLGGGTSAQFDPRAPTDCAAAEPVQAVLAPGTRRGSLACPVGQRKPGLPSR